MDKHEEEDEVECGRARLEQAERTEEEETKEAKKAHQKSLKKQQRN